MTMPSPHEFATLMLVRSAPDQIDMTRGERKRYDDTPARDDNPLF